MKRKLIIFLSIIAILSTFLVALSFADVKIILLDGQTFSVSSVKFKNDLVYLPDGKSIDREKIKEIHFFEGEKGWKYEPVKPDMEAYKAYLKEGQRLAAKYPGFSAYAVEDENIFQVNRDGTTSRTSHMIYFIAKEDASDFSSMAVYINEQRERIKFHALRAVTADLKIQDVDPANINTKMVNDSTRFFNRYLTVSTRIPNCGQWGLMETYYTNENYNPHDPKMWFSTNYHQSSLPVSRSTYLVKVPKGTYINYVTPNMDDESAKPKISTVGDFDTYYWETGEMGPIIYESSMPPMADITPMVMVSPFKDRSYLYQFFERIVGDKIVPNELVRETTLEVTKGSKDNEEKVARVYHFVQRKIRYISIKGSIGSGFGGHAAWLTLQNRYGDCVDKAILMSAMLQTVDIEAEVVYLMTNGGSQFMGKIPTVHANHAISRVTLNGKSFYLDSTATNYRYPAFRTDDHGSVAMLYKNKTYEFIPHPPPEMNLDKMDFKIEMDSKGGFKMLRVHTGTGATEAGMRNSLTGIKEKDRKEALMKLAAALSVGGSLLEYEDTGVEDLATPVMTKVRWFLPEYARRSGKYYYFKLPFVREQFGWASLPERKYPIYVPSGSATEKNYEVTLPPGFKVLALPDPLNISNEYFDVLAKYELSGNLLKFTYKALFRASRIPVSKYPDYRAALIRVEKYLQEEIFILGGKGGRK